MKWFWRWKKTSKKETAVVFIDYEYWYVSYYKMYHERPDLMKLRNILEEQYCIKRILIFADFTKDNLMTQVKDLEQIADNVINTYRKDFKRKGYITEICMLDLSINMRLKTHKPIVICFFPIANVFVQ